MRKPLAFTFAAPASRAAGAACALFVAAAAFIHASRGIEWSCHFHPDEAKIARWIGQSQRDGYVSDRVYPGGWFVLANMWMGVHRFISGQEDMIAKKRTQDGKVIATVEESFTEREPMPGKRDYIQFGRDLNVLLFSLAALLLYLAARETGAPAAASSAAALLFAAQPFALEAAHYCETDMGLVFSLCLSGWMAVRALGQESRSWMIAAGAAAGFAIACKYTLTPLLVCVPVLAWAVARRRGDGRRAAFGLAGLALLAAIAGFLAGTPALWMAPGFCFGSLLRVGSATYGESARAIGAGHSYAAGCLWRTRALATEAARLGSAPLLLFAACLAAWFAPGYRRWLPAHPLFAAAFLVFAVFAMPWIRTQELLPLVPCLCLGAAPALSLAWAAVARGRRPRLRIAGAAFAALFALGFSRSLDDGFRVLSCFQRRDTRVACQNWFYVCADAGVSVAAEPYVSQSLRATGCSAVSYRNAAKTWPALAKTPQVAEGATRYLLRNASFAGRREFGSDATRSEEKFRGDCLRLLHWSIAPGRMRTTTFAQPDIELWSLPRPDTAPADIPLCVDRPAFFTPGPFTVCPPAEDVPGIGPVRAVCTVGARRTLHPPAIGAGWAVSQICDGPKNGSIAWEGLFRPKRAALSPAGTALFRLDEGAFRFAARHDVRPGARVRIRGANDQETVCATRFSSDPAETARVLRRAGDAAAALAFLRGLPALDDAARA